MNEYTVTCEPLSVRSSYGNLYNQLCCSTVWKL